MTTSADFLKIVLFAAIGSSAALSTDLLVPYFNVTSAERLPQNLSHPRTLGQTYAKAGGLTYEEETLLLQKHNEYRAMSNSSNMRIMEWNDDLKKLAQDMADKCIYKHSPSSYRSNVGGFKRVGENLYCGNHEFPLTQPVKMWYDEIVDYNFATTGCTPNKMCGHYTQVVWHHSYALGCGYTFCENLQNAPRIPKGYLVVCHYGPAGNYRGQKPFKKGKPCADCNKKELPYCIKKMCSTRPYIGSASQLPWHSTTVLSLTLLITVSLDVY